jgi:cbb3-type cytochrome oxidase subunit 3
MLTIAGGILIAVIAFFVISIAFVGVLGWIFRERGEKSRAIAERQYALHMARRKSANG